MKKQLLTLLIFILFFNTKSFAQTAWTVYNKSNSGILNDTVLTMEFDSQGNKWIGTYSGGLCKFDGTNWINYNTGNSGITHNNIRSIKIDNEGNKWIGTWGGGLCKFDGTNWVNYKTTNSGIASNNIRSIAIDNQGNKWIGNVGGLSMFNGTNWVNYKPATIGIGNNNNINIVSCVAIDNQGNKWIGTYDGLSMFDGTNWINYKTTNSGIASNSITSITIDNQGNKWIGTSLGVSKFDGTNWVTYNLLNSGIKGNYITSITIDNQENKWIGSNGLNKFEDINWVNFYKGNSDLTNNVINFISIDDQGNKWIGTWGGGLYKLTGDGNSNICSAQNVITTKYNKLCSNSTVTLYSKIQDNNYNYFWYAKNNQGNNVVLQNNNQSQITSKIGGYHYIRISDNYCYSLDSILVTPTDSLGKPPLNTSINSKSIVKCANSSAIFYNPYPKACKMEWIDGNLNIISPNKDSLISYTSGKFGIRVYDSLCEKAYNTNYFYADVYDTIIDSPSICMVTNQNGYNMLVWENIDNNFIDKYKIYKQNQQTSNYELVYEQSNQKLSQWIDSLSQPNNRTERYKISILDTCSRETTTSDYHATILLSSNVGLNGTVNLAWNAYVGFSYSNFEIWRSTDGINFYLLSIVANNNFAYIDTNPPSTAWYQIRVVKQGGCIPTTKSYISVNSNIISKEGIALGIKAVSEDVFSIYPNPTKDVLFIDNGNYQAMNGYFIKIISLTGAVIYNQAITTQQVQISMNQFATKGLYIAQILDANNTIVDSKKIVLE